MIDHPTYDCIERQKIFNPYDGLHVLNTLLLCFSTPVLSYVPKNNTRLKSLIGFLKLSWSIPPTYPSPSHSPNVSGLEPCLSWKPTGVQCVISIPRQSRNVVLLLTLFTFSVKVVFIIDTF